MSIQDHWEVLTTLNWSPGRDIPLTTYVVEDIVPMSTFYPGGKADERFDRPWPAYKRRRFLMPLKVEEKIAVLDPPRRRKVEDRAAELIAEEMSLRQLRKARQLTQAHVARQLGISQDGVSRLEQRSDLLLSTLRKTVEAMGGSLSLIVRFPDRPPVELSGITEGSPPTATSKAKPNG